MWVWFWVSTSYCGLVEVISQMQIQKVTVICSQNHNSEFYRLKISILWYTPMMVLVFPTLYDQRQMTAPKRGFYLRLKSYIPHVEQDFTKIVLQYPFWRLYKSRRQLYIEYHWTTLCPCCKLNQQVWKNGRMMDNIQMDVKRNCFLWLLCSSRYKLPTLHYQHH